jgi:hypothetical protein
MTDEQINQRIAEACGWTDCNEYIGKPPTRKMDQCNRSLPNYAGCLNAMHEAEKILTPKQESKYVTTLCLEVQTTPSLFNATARQRAEAFLRTIGKWEEEA